MTKGFDIANTENSESSYSGGKTVIKVNTAVRIPKGEWQQ